MDGVLIFLVEYRMEVIVIRRFVRGHAVEGLMEFG